MIALDVLAQDRVVGGFDDRGETLGSRPRVAAVTRLGHLQPAPARIASSALGVGLEPIANLGELEQVGDRRAAAQHQRQPVAELARGDQQHLEPARVHERHPESGRGRPRPRCPRAAVRRAAASASAFSRSTSPAARTTIVPLRRSMSSSSRPGVASLIPIRPSPRSSSRRSARPRSSRNARRSPGLVISEIPTPSPGLSRFGFIPTPSSATSTSSRPRSTPGGDADHSLAAVAKAVDDRVARRPRRPPA